MASSAQRLGLTQSCEDAVVEQLLDLQRRAVEYAQRDGRIASDEFFFAEQNARLIRDAEEYYRSMFRGRVSSWNLRDQHMSDMLDALFAHFLIMKAMQRSSCGHNSHLGDARATPMGEIGATQSRSAHGVVAKPGDSGSQKYE
jgi:erythromycin esterase-like protein